MCQTKTFQTNQKRKVVDELRKKLLNCVFTETVSEKTDRLKICFEGRMKKTR